MELKSKVWRFYLLLLFSFFLQGAVVAASPDLDYEVSFDTAHHYLNVEMTVSQIDAEKTVLKLPVWAPGYYLIVDYPKLIVDFSAEDTAGRALRWEKFGKSDWVVETKDVSSFKVKYRVYANDYSVAESRVTKKVAFIAPNGVFMYLDGRKDLPVEVAFHMPKEWKSASTGLKRLPAAGVDSGQSVNRFYAENIDVLYDSPLLFGNHMVMHFTHEGHAYELALETPDGVEETTFVEDLKKMMSATTRLIGDVPYDRYCYILLCAGGGGLEHFNSQACYTSGSFRFADRMDYLNFLSFITHEYFHLYNVKSIRPIELGPFDYDREVFTPMLWVSEGFTVYYESALLRAAGLVDGDYLLNDLSGYIRTVESKEGHKHMSLRQSSYDIWLNFFNRKANAADTRISYYDKGPILGLLMDIEIRRLTDNGKSLDDVMRALYYIYYKEKGRGFTEEEFWEVCADVAGQPLTDMRRYVNTTDAIDYERCLAYAGLELDRKNWQLRRMEKVDALQEKIRKSLIGD